SGSQVMKAFAALPVLKECTIRLGRRRNNDLRSLARDTSLRMTRAFVPKPHFPYERLPQELRLRILDFTHLRAHGAYHDRYKPLRIEQSKLVKGNVIHVHRPICCSKCTETFADCCCPTTRASYSASCECRLLPFDLFLVSKQMYQDALITFYSNN